MSFLQELLDKKFKLKCTETIVTDVDGRKFIENGDKKVQLDETSYGFVVDTKSDHVPAQISEYIYLGSQDCCEFSVLEENNIEFVLSVGIMAPCTKSNVVYRFVPCLDLPETDIVEILKKDCVDFIDDALRNQKKVLVHCNAGVSRSSSVVIGYLMIKDGLSYRKAYDLVKSKRECIRPNEGFRKGLRKLQEMEGTGR